MWFRGRRYRIARVQVTTADPDRLPTRTVFDTLADLRDDAQWNSQVSSAELLSGEPIGPGSRFAIVNGGTPCDVTGMATYDRDGQAERLPTGDEDVLTAVVVERFPGESAIESFEAQARDLEEPKPFVLGCPPERTGSTIVQGDVDSVIADAVVVRVRQRRVGMLAVDGGCDVMVEGERVPGEAAVRPKRCRYPLEAAATIGPRGQMQQ